MTTNKTIHIHSYNTSKKIKRAKTKGHQGIGMTRKPGARHCRATLEIPVVTNVYTNIDDVLGSRASQF